MAKASSFWNRICEDFNYRFFTGIPFKEVTELYHSMDPEIMHYIPAAHEEIAIRLATGAWISGFKSAVILEPKKVQSVSSKLNRKYNIPILFITSEAPSNPTDFFISDNIEKLDAAMTAEGRSGILVVGQEV